MVEATHHVLQLVPAGGVGRPRVRGHRQGCRGVAGPTEYEAGCAFARTRCGWASAAIRAGRELAGGVRIAARRPMGLCCVFIHRGGGGRRSWWLLFVLVTVAQDTGTTLSTLAISECARPPPSVPELWPLNLKFHPPERALPSLSRPNFFLWCAPPMRSQEGSTQQSHAAQTCTWHKAVESVASSLCHSCRCQLQN
jgi:hypothetical protein